MKKGIFISFEGTDGAGKSTQIAFAEDYFKSRGYDVVMTREPGGTQIGEKLREILLDKSNSEMSSVTEMMIYSAARAQLVAEVIRPALEAGQVVICDRFVDSSIAYQDFGSGLGVAVSTVNSFAIGDSMPDLTVFLDLDPAIGRSRIGKTDMDRLEQEDIDFFYRVYNGYRELAEANPDRIASVNAAGTVDEVRAEIEAAFARILRRISDDE